jgi:hypothetical protein
MSVRASRIWKVAAGLVGGGAGAVAGYVAATFLYVGARTVADPTFEPIRAGETAYVALAGGVFGAALGAVIGVLTARIATGA